MKPFRWTRYSEQAALLVAQDALTNVEIAAEVHITDRTLLLWKKQPEFQARVSEHVETFRRLAKEKGVADLVKRLQALNDRWERMKQVIEERAADPSMKDVPGGTTGLLVHTVKGVGKGDDFQMIHLYAVDTALLAEMRQIEKQAAIEVGQWEEKAVIKTDGPMLIKVIKGVSMDDL